MVSAMSGGQPVGLSVNSFTSVSLEPPLVSFCVGNRSRTWGFMAEAASLGVSILAEDQQDLSRRFAGAASERFRGVGWHPAPSGAPILDSCLAWIDCVPEPARPAGDHHLVIARVTALERQREAGPLVFYGGDYGHFER